MKYEAFAQLAQGKTVDEIIKIVRENIDGLKLRNTYYNTYTLFTEDGVAVAQHGSANNGQAPLRLKAAAYKLSAEAVAAKKADDEVRNDAAQFVGKTIWGKEIINAESIDGEIKIEIAGGKVYGFKNISKLISLAK